MSALEKDLKLLKEKLPLWQENYIEKVIEGYKKLLNSDENASNKFWQLNDLITKDKKNPGVLITNLKRSNMDLVIESLIINKVINIDDLNDFSLELQKTIKLYLSSLKYEKKEN